MSKPIIEVEHLSKCYRIGAMREPYLSLREELAKKTRRISSAFSRAFGNGQTRPSDSETDFWALNDVNFSVQEGEAVGIIGSNGAGKSTVLKILSQITPPTKGQITMRGRVASLLEVGTGFHTELTGRENIFLNGAIMGMRREEIKRKFDEIVAFGEVEKFLDTPVKRYSSGMYVRLAFAVAAHLEPEILIVDEVLAVGDAQFQKKCIGKMEEVGKDGRTVLFVSHNMGVINNLCKSAFLLEKGELLCTGPVQDVVRQYEMKVMIPFSSTGLADGVICLNNNINADNFDIVEISLLDLKYNPINHIKTFDSFAFKISFYSPKVQRNASVELFVQTMSGLTLLRISTRPDSSFDMDFKEGINTIYCFIKDLSLPAGTYLIGFGLAIPMREWLFHKKEICIFNVERKDIHGSGFPPIQERALSVVEYRWELA